MKLQEAQKIESELKFVFYSLLKPFYGKYEYVIP
jgi:hypothetical protein